VAGLRAFSVSLAYLMTLRFPCVLIVAALLSSIDPPLLLVLPLINVLIALVLALKHGDRIYRWWLSGYPAYVPGRETAKSEPKRPLKERIHLWWLRGYDNYEELSAYQKLTKSSIGSQGGAVTVEQDLGTVEHGSEILLAEEGTVEHQNVNKKARVETVEPSSSSLVLPSEKPSKEDLDMLKEILGIEKGCPQYKERGDGVWLSVYDRETKKKRWTKIGSWSDLQHLIYQQALPQNVDLSRKED